MELAFVIYLIEVVTQLKVIKDIGIILFLFSCITFFAVTLYHYLEDEQEKIPDYLKFLKAKTCFLLGFFFLLLSAFIPTKETAYTMLAAYGVTEIVKNEDVQRLGSRSLLVLEQAIDDYLRTSEEPN